MSWEQFGDDKRKNDSRDSNKDITVGGGNSSYYYAIFRIAEKYKTINSLGGFVKHMEREIDVANADKNIKNEILIGDRNVVENVKEYIKECKLRKNSIIGRSILMSASPDFFRGLSVPELERWKNDNIKFLKEKFGSNCRYATLHKDEKTWHIHALIIPRFYDEKKKTYIVANSRYFDGIERMRGWQDNYSDSMKEHFKCLNRGIRFSKQKHQSMKKFYGKLADNINDNDIEQLRARAKQADLLQMKIKGMQETLQVYQLHNISNEKTKEDAKNMMLEIEKLKDDKEKTKEVIAMLSQQYHMPKYAIINAIKFCENINDKEHER